MQASRGRFRFGISVFFFLSGFTFTTWASRIPDMQRQFHLTDAALGSLLMLLPLGLMSAMPLAGYLFSRFSSRKILLTSSILYILLICALALAANVWQLGIILFLFGACRNLFNISINTQAVGIQSLHTNSIMATFHGIWSVAGFAGAAIASIITSKHIPVITHFSIIAAISFIIILLNFNSILSTDYHTYERKPAFVLPDKALIKFGIIAFCSMICEGTISEWGSIYFGRVVNVQKEMITIGYVAYLWAMTVGRFTGDWLANKIGSKRILQMSGGLILFGILLVIILPYLITATVGYVLIGFGVSCIMPLVFSTAGKQSKMATGQAITAVSTIGYLGFLLGPPLVGFISQSINMQVSFLLVALAGIGIIFFSSKTAFASSKG